MQFFWKWLFIFTILYGLYCIFTWYGWMILLAGIAGLFYRFQRDTEDAAYEAIAENNREQQRKRE